MTLDIHLLGEKISELLLKAVNLEYLEIASIDKCQKFELVISHPQLRVLKLGEGSQELTASKIFKSKIAIKGECFALTQVYFLSASHNLEMQIGVSLQRVKIVASEAILALRGGSILHDLGIHALKSPSFKYLAHVCTCSLHILQVSSFVVPKCNLLESLTLFV